MLTEMFGFHPRAVRECFERNHVPKVHLYADHAFLVLHAPELGRAGHVPLHRAGPVHRTQLSDHRARSDESRGALAETRAVLRRIVEGRLRPASTFDLSYAIVCALTRRHTFVAALARELGLLEQRVMFNEAKDDPEQF